MVKNPKRPTVKRGSKRPSSREDAALVKKLSHLLDKVLENTADGIIITNQNDEISFINPSAKRMLGLPCPRRAASAANHQSPVTSHRRATSKTKPTQTDKLEGISTNKPTLDDLKKISATKNLADIIRRAHKELDVICEELVVNADLHQTNRQRQKPSKGEERVIISTSSPLKDADGRTIGVATFLRDVTEFRQFDRMKSEFILNISHEIRTPLTVIKGSIDNLLHEVCGKLTKKQRDYLSQTKDSAEQLIKQIEKLLAFN